MNERISQYYFILNELSQTNSTISYLDKVSLNENVKNNRINYDVFFEDNKRFKEKFLHIFFNKNSNSTATAKYISETLPDTKKIKTFIYLSRKKGLTSKAYEEIEKILKPTSIDYIQELIKEISLKKSNSTFERIEYDTPKAFVFPTIKVDNDFNTNQKVSFDKIESFDKQFLTPWYNQEDFPVLIIKGNGGIGKTTIAQFISNIIINKNNHTSNIYIDSIEAKKRLISKFNNNSSIELYDLYVSSLGNESFLDNDLFNYNLDAGNVFIIIDGIDELISKVNNFDIKKFLQSIQNFNNKLKNTKILITCRNQFWDEITDNTKTVEIIPFTETQTLKFFNESFNKNDRKVKKAMQIAKDFHKKNTIQKNIYHPYALDLITRIIEDNVLIKDAQNTKLLNTKLTLDYIISKICNRERFLNGEIRVTNLTIDEQVKIFQYISINYNGKINYEELETCIYMGLNNSLEKTQNFKTSKLVKSLSSHPLFSVDQNEIKFSYDFLVDFFKSTYIANYFDFYNEDSITINFLKLLKDCWFGSSLTLDVARRIPKWGNDEFDKIINLISEIDKLNISSLDKKEQDILEKDIDEFEISEMKEVNNDKSPYYSGIFNLAFEVHTRYCDSQPTKIQNTRLLKNIYGKDKITNLCILNVNESILFDFSSIHSFENCEFIGFKSFWDCEFNEKNYFYNCTFEELGQKHNKKEILLKLNDYQNFDKSSYDNMDSEFKKQFTDSKDYDDELKSEINSFVEQFVFFFNTEFGLKARNYVNEDLPCLKIKYDSFSDLNFPLDKFISIAENIELIEWSYFNKNVKLINISKKYRSDVIKHLKEDSYCTILEEFKDLLYKEIR